MFTLTQKQIDSYREIEKLVEDWDVFIEHDENHEYYRISQEYGMDAFMDIELHKDWLIHRYLVAKTMDGYCKVYSKSHELLDDIEDIKDFIKYVMKKLEHAGEEWHKFKDATFF